MLNPDNIPPEIGWPIAVLLWFVLLAMILWDRRKLNKLVKAREEALTLSNEDADGINFHFSPPTTRREARNRKPVSNFYDQEQDHVG